MFIINSDGDTSITPLSPPYTAPIDANYQLVNITSNTIFNTGRIFSVEKNQSFEVFNKREEFVEVEAPGTSAVYVDVKYELVSDAGCLALGEVNEFKQKVLIDYSKIDFKALQSIRIQGSLKATSSYSPEPAYSNFTLTIKKCTSPDCGGA